MFLTLLSLLWMPFSDDTAGAPAWIEKYRAAAIERWEKDIRQLEELDQQQTDPEGAVLFLGSSSIRRWKTIADDVAPYAAIRRGYGGAKYSDLAIFVDRLLKAHRPKAVVIFVGNDISGKEDDKRPAQVQALCKYVASRIRAQYAETPVLFVAVTPTSKRFAVWPKVRRSNQLLQDYADATKAVYFVATEDLFLDAQKQPIDELFIDDKLHLNAQGYKLWGARIRNSLDAALKAN